MSSLFQAFFYHVLELHKVPFEISDTVIIILQITITGLLSAEAIKATINWIEVAKNPEEQSEG